jgi:hypothetical protein
MHRQTSRYPLVFRANTRLEAFLQARSRLLEVALGSRIVGDASEPASDAETVAESTCDNHALLGVTATRRQVSLQIAQQRTEETQVGACERRSPGAGQVGKLCEQGASLPEVSS